MDVALAIKMTADAGDASAAFADVGDSAKTMAADVDSAAAKTDSSMSSVADSADNLGSSSSQAAGGLGDLGGALAAAPGPLGAVGAGMETLAPLVMGVTGATDLATLAMNSNIVTSARQKAAMVAQAAATRATSAATKTAAVVQWALNAAMSANPIGIVVVAIAALVAGLVLAYNKSETFRNIVQGAMQVAKAAVSKVVEVVGDIASKVADVVKKVPGLSGAFETAKGLVVGYIDLMTTPIRTLLGIVQDVVDWVGKIDFPDPPGWFNKITGSGRTAAGGGGFGSLSADLRNPDGALGARSVTQVNVDLRTLDLRGSAVRDLVTALRREGISIGNAVVSS